MAEMEKMNKPVRLTNLDKLAALASEGINKAQNTANAGFKKIIQDGNTIKFYTDSDATLVDAAADSFDFAAESFLDQARTTFSTSFTFSTATFGTDTTNPNLDGKPVLILAVKTKDAQNNETLNYSFLNVESLVDIYGIATDTTSARVLTMEGNRITFKLSTDADNARRMRKYRPIWHRRFWFCLLFPNIRKKHCKPREHLPYRIFLRLCIAEKTFPFSWNRAKTFPLIYATHYCKFFLALPKPCS